MSEAKELYQEIGEHLLNDPEPSVYLKSLLSRPEMKERPFSLVYELQKAEQSPQFHPEGNAWNHTLLVVDEAAKVRQKSSNAAAFMWAALLHDIGKPATTKNRKGKITSYDHDKVGARLAREFLSVFCDDHEFIDEVCYLILYHMHILYVVKGLPFADIKGMKERSDINEIALLGLCDRLGRLGYDRQAEESNIRQFLQKVK